MTSSVTTASSQTGTSLVPAQQTATGPERRRSPCGRGAGCARPGRRSTPSTARFTGPAFSGERRVTSSGPCAASLLAMATTCAAVLRSASTTSGIPWRRARWVSRVATSPSRSKGAALSAATASSSGVAPLATRFSSRRRAVSSIGGQRFRVEVAEQPGDAGRLGHHQDQPLQLRVGRAGEAGRQRHRAGVVHQPLDAGLAAAAREGRDREEQGLVHQPGHGGDEGAADDVAALHQAALGHGAEGAPHHRHAQRAGQRLGVVLGERQQQVAGERPLQPDADRHQRRCPWRRGSRRWPRRWRRSRTRARPCRAAARSAGPAR